MKGKISRRENPERHAYALTIHNINNTTNSQLRKYTGGDKFTESQEKINKNTSLDNINLFAKKITKKELEILIQTIKTYKVDILMK